MWVCWLFADESFPAVKAADDRTGSSMESAEVSKCCLGAHVNISICCSGSAGAQVSNTATRQRVEHDGSRVGAIGVTWESGRPRRVQVWHVCDWWKLVPKQQQAHNTLCHKSVSKSIRGNQRLPVFSLWRGFWSTCSSLCALTVSHVTRTWGTWWILQNLAQRCSVLTLLGAWSVWLWELHSRSAGDSWSYYVFDLSAPVMRTLMSSETPRRTVAAVGWVLCLQDFNQT